MTEPVEHSGESAGAPGRAAIVISIIGGGSAGDRALSLAGEVGERVARAGAVLACGGLGGVMEAACRGARREGGTTLGILPGRDRSDANPWVSVAVPTGMGLMRNSLVVFAGDALIAVDGAYGTLNEITIALNHGVPVVCLESWDLRPSGVSPDDVHMARDPEDAVETALRLASQRRS